jgi:hypothetical protein
MGGAVWVAAATGVGSAETGPLGVDAWDGGFADGGLLPERAKSTS